MCGIVGKIHFLNGQVSEAEIHRMNNRIQHRGPDDHGIFINKNKTVGLGHRRLSIIDLSPAGRNPMSNENGKVWIVFNGEIYNFLLLKPDLEQKGHVFKSNSDTEVILHLWEEYGEKCVSFLRGMFAFAIWDEGKKQLFLARDRLGKKPLKYFYNDKEFFFASELKAFLNEPGVPREVDEEAIHYYLTFQYVPSPWTGFKHIKKIPPAHYLLVDLSKEKPNIILKKYWSLNFSNKLKGAPEELGNILMEKLEESVKLRLIADVPLGAFLSGGVDSSAVVSLMAKNTPGKVKTFSIGFKEQGFNELPYARQIAEQYHTDHHEFIVEPMAVEILPQLAYLYEEPYADSSALPTYYLAKLTREFVTVALNGDGGDENFAGYPWHYFIKKNATYRKFPDFLRKIVSYGAQHGYHYCPSRLLRYLKIFSKGSFLSFGALHSEALAYFSYEEKENLYKDEFKKKTIPWDSSRILETCYEKAKKYDIVDQVLFTDISHYLPDDLLVKVDIATMAHGLEGRSPLLDHEFMEVIARIPSIFKLKGKNGKAIFKKALSKELPKDLLYRKKHGFSVPIGKWFSSSLKNYSEEILLKKDYFTDTLLKEEGIRDLLKRHAKTGEEGRRIWALLMLKLWYEQFFK